MGRAHNYKLICNGPRKRDNPLRSEVPPIRQVCSPSDVCGSEARARDMEASDSLFALGAEAKTIPSFGVGGACIQLGPCNLCAVRAHNILLVRATEV